MLTVISNFIILISIIIIIILIIIIMIGQVLIEARSRLLKVDQKTADISLITI